MFGYPMSAVRKAIIASISVIVAVGNVLVQVMGDGTITTQDWVTVGVALAVALGVYKVRNEPYPVV